MLNGKRAILIFSIVAVPLGGAIYLQQSIKRGDLAPSKVAVPSAVAEVASSRTGKGRAEAKAVSVAGSDSRESSLSSPGGGSASFNPAGKRPDPARAEDWSSYVDEPVLGGGSHYEGEPVAAYVSVGDANVRRIRMLPNQAGEYSRVWMQGDRVAQVSLEFVETAPGTEVAVVAEDGGSFSASPKVSSVLRVDDQRRISFDFHVSQNPGVHRVAVRTPDGGTKLLDFWAGEPPAIQTSAR